MLWTIFVILLILCLLGFTVFHIGSLIHLVLVIALIVWIVNLIADRRSLCRAGLAELPELVTSGVLTPEAADALRQHYSSQPSGEPRRIGFILSAILGSLLVGAGIILLVAHNWDFLSRPIRCAIAFTPLNLSQALALFVLIRRNGSAAWRETAAILNVARSEEH